MYLYPKANPLIDFKVVDNTIAEWLIDAPVPTDDELIEAWDAYLNLPPQEPEPDLTETLGILLLESANDKATISNLEDTLGTVMLELANLKGGNA